MPTASACSTALCQDLVLGGAAGLDAILATGAADEPDQSGFAIDRDIAHGPAGGVVKRLACLMSATLPIYRAPLRAVYDRHGQRAPGKPVA